jgi:hypothetical protein
MRFVRWKVPLPTRCALALGVLAGTAGPGCCAAFPAQPAEVREYCAGLDQCRRQHVYVFMINGLTIVPHIYGSLDGYGEALPALGYTHLSVGTHYDRWKYLNQIRCIYQSDPQARIVLIGYSIGGSVVHSVARTLEKEGIPIALLVYLDAHTFVNNFHHRPGNVCRAICITSSGLVLKGRTVYEADAVYHVEGAWHLGVPKTEAVRLTLACELDAVAATVALPWPQ